ARTMAMAVFFGLVALTFLGIGPATGQVPADVKPAPKDGPKQGSPDTFYQVPRFDGHSVLWGHRAADPELDKYMQEEASAEHEVARLVAEYARTDSDEERGKIRAKIATALGTQFTAQQKRRERELKRLEEQLTKLRNLMQKRS